MCPGGEDGGGDLGQVEAEDAVEEKGEPLLGCEICEALLKATNF